MVVFESRMSAATCGVGPETDPKSTLGLCSEIWSMMS